jgi:hypothetical protein
MPNPDRGQENQSAILGDDNCSLQDDPSALEKVYPVVCANHSAIADFRAKLLALLPTVSGAAIFVLLGDKDKDAAEFAAIGLFGFAVTFGLFLYDLRHPGLRRAPRPRWQN